MWSCHCFDNAVLVVKPPADIVCIDDQIWTEEFPAGVHVTCVSMSCLLYIINRTWKPLASLSCYGGDALKSFICLHRNMTKLYNHCPISLQVQSRCGSNENILRASKFSVCVCLYLSVCGSLTRLLETVIYI